MKFSDVRLKAREEVLADIERLIQQNLNDPDLLARSAEYREGYARGMRETMIMISFSLWPRMISQR